MDIVICFCFIWGICSIVFIASQDPLLLPQCCLPSCLTVWFPFSVSVSSSPNFCLYVCLCFSLSISLFFFLFFILCLHPHIPLSLPSSIPVPISDYLPVCRCLSLLLTLILLWCPSFPAFINIMFIHGWQLLLCRSVAIIHYLWPRNSWSIVSEGVPVTIWGEKGVSNL